MADQGEIARRARERIGTVLRGKYRIDRVLGTGGMAVVYAATHRNSKQVAVKMLHPELSLREDIRSRFLREGYAANSVKHKGAVDVLDDDTAEDGAAFLVMELLEGAPIEELWERNRRRLPPPHVLAIGHQVLDVLAAAHPKGIVHRDLKPANLFLTYEARVKVLDFGIARVRDAATSGAHATGSGLLLGTPAFMAPEQALAQTADIDAQTDLWAVGATLFTLLSGRLVHEGESAPQIMVKSATTPAPSLASVVPDAPAPIAAVIDRALAFKKGDRWESATRMRDAIAAAHAEAFGGPIVPESLLPLFEKMETAIAPTRHALELQSTSTARPAQAKPATSPLAETSSPAIPETRPSEAPPKQVGGTTAQPVSSANAPFDLIQTRSKRRWGVIAGGAATVTLVAALAGTLASRSLGRHSQSSLSATSDVTLAPSAPTEPVTASATAPPPAPVDAPVASIATVPTATAASTPSRQVAGATPPPSPKPATAPHASERASAAPSAPPSPAATASAPVCTVVTDYDNDGLPHFRKVCK